MGRRCALAVSPVCRCCSGLGQRMFHGKRWWRTTAKDPDRWGLRLRTPSSHFRRRACLVDVRTVYWRYAAELVSTLAIPLCTGCVMVRRLLGAAVPRADRCWRDHLNHPGGSLATASRGGGATWLARFGASGRRPADATLRSLRRAWRHLPGTSPVVARDLGLLRPGVGGAGRMELRLGVVGYRRSIRRGPDLQASPPWGRPSEVRTRS